MTRKNFPTRVKVACIKRATKDGIIYCEKCGALSTRFEIDHDNPDGLTGEPVLENAILLCLPCHAEKTKSDVGNIAKAKRREAKDLGATKPKGDIPGRGFAPGRQKRTQKPSLLPLKIYGD